MNTRHIYGYTAHESDRPAYLAINEIDGEIQASLRSRDGQTARLVLPADELRKLCCLLMEAYNKPVAWRFMNPAHPEQGWSYTEQEVKEHPSLLLKTEPLYSPAHLFKVSLPE